jgi:hypothetical protein
LGPAAVLFRSDFKPKKSAPELFTALERLKNKKSYYFFLEAFLVVFFLAVVFFAVFFLVAIFFSTIDSDPSYDTTALLVTVYIKRSPLASAGESGQLLRLTETCLPSFSEPAST